LAAASEAAVAAVAALPAAEAASLAASTAEAAAPAAAEAAPVAAAAAASADGVSAGTTTTEGAGATTSSFLPQAARATAATMAAKTRDLFIFRSLMIFKKTISGNCQKILKPIFKLCFDREERTRALSTQP
jgi:hypothetical protein